MSDPGLCARKAPPEHADSQSRFVGMPFVPQTVDKATAISAPGLLL